jgi:hypothetical protein
VLARNPGVALYHGRVVGYWRRHPTQTTSRHAHALIRERWRVIRDVVSTLDPAARDAVGWTEVLARENRARWCIGAGRAALRAGRFARARRLHLEALRAGPGLALRLRALSGVAASASRLDLPGTWRRLRGRA